MQKYDLSYKRFGERAVLIEWPPIIDRDILGDVLIFKKKILDFYSDENTQTTHAYQSIVVYYSYNDFNYEKELAALKGLYSSDTEIKKDFSRLWTIPVCYDDHFGIDLEELSSLKNLSKEEIISLHTQAIYPVYFIGFLPGFLYLGGLNKLLHTPRRQSPRLKVSQGAVAIGGKQTGVYPNESPGGWHIIGNSPMHFFDASKSSPCFAKAGDSIKFSSISLEEYGTIRALVEADVYQMESEVLDG